MEMDINWGNLYP